MTLPEALLTLYGAYFAGKYGVLGLIAFYEDMAGRKKEDK